MGKLLERILENYEAIFWVLIVLGSSIASWFKARAEKKRREQGGLPADGEVLVEGAEPQAPGSPDSTGSEGEPTVFQELYGELTREFSDADPAGPTATPTAAPARKPIRSPRRAPSPPPPPLPPPVPQTSVAERPGLASAQELGSLESRKLETALDEDFFADLSERFDGDDLSSLERVLETRKLGDLERVHDVHTPSDKPQQSAWQPSGSWRDAIVMRELLGPPQAMRQDDLPGLSA